jgi:hypothetical protein
MDLPIYHSFAEKEMHFKIIKVDCIEQLKEVIIENSQGHGIYRGVSSSRYKIYTSLQRQIISNDLTSFDLNQYVNNTRDTEVLSKYFTNFNIPPSKLSIYSYLQHFGAPSPYIDFSTNFIKALYFGIENFDISDFRVSDSIDDYISVFVIKTNDLELVEIPRVISSLKESKDLSQRFLEHYEDYNYSDLITHLDNLFDINTLPIYLIDHRKDFVDIYNTYNNIRIIAQEGLFLSNTYFDKPLEEGLKEFFIEATQFQSSPWDEDDSPRALEINEQYYKDLEKNRGFQKRLEDNIITSYEINKKLIPEIRIMIRLSKDDIYPNPENIVWEIFQNTLAKEKSA